MTHPSEDLLVLYVGGELSKPQQDRVRRHLDECQGCARAVEQIAEMDRVLRGVPPLPVPDAFPARVRARLMLSPASRPRWREAVAAALIALAGLGGGWTMASSRASQAASAIVRNAEGPKFALFFAEDPESWVGVSQEERDRRLDQFMEWMHGIGDTSVRLGGSELDQSRGRIVGASSRAMDPQLALSGFIVIRVATYEEAVAHASRCPLLARGGQVIVRRMR